MAPLVLGFGLGKGPFLCYTSLMQPSTKFPGLLVLVATIAAFHVWGESVLGLPVAHADDLTNSIITQGSLIIGMIITAMNFLMWILFKMLEIVTDPDIIFNDGMRNVLFALWALFRNMVNVAFALLLIAGAIITVVTANTDRVKGVLPKFVMAVILVNFSWFIPRVIFDVSQVVAYSVYQLPTWVGNGADVCMTEEWGPGGMGPPARVPCKVVNEMKFLKDTDTVIAEVDGWDCTLKPLVCVQFKPYNSPEVRNRANKSSVIYNGLIINYARLRTLANVLDAGRVANQQPGDIGALLVWFVQIIVVLVIHIALFFPVLALVCAFFIRIPVLWLTMAFMPFVVLGFVVDQIKADTDKISDTFIKAAFLPAIVGVPLSIGFILINIGSVAMPDIPGMKIQLPLLAGLRNFTDLFWLMLSLGVLWKGVFMALERGPSIVNHFSAGIKGTGEAMGRVALKAPLSVPLPFLSTSVLGLRNAARNVEANLDAAVAKQGAGKAQTELVDTHSKQLSSEGVKNFKTSVVSNVNQIINDPNSAATLKAAIAKLRTDSPNLSPNASEEDALKAVFKNLENTGEKLDELTKQNLQRALKRPPPAAPAPTPPAGGTPTP